MDKSPLLKLVARSARILPFVFAGITVVAFLTAIALALQGKPTFSMPALSFRIAVVVTLASAVIALWGLFNPPKVPQDLVQARLLIIVFGAASGLAVTLLGVTFAIDGKAEIMAWLSGQAVAGEKNPVLRVLSGTFGGWQVLSVLVAVYGGLAIMFVSFGIAEGLEREYANLRRLIYGYNALLNGLLLFSILVLLNAFVAMRAASPIDFTSNGFYSLSSKSQGILRSIKQPVRAVLFMGEREFPYTDTYALLNNFQAVNAKFKVEWLSPLENRDTVEQLRKKYPDMQSSGVLLIAGDALNEHQWVSADDLIEAPMARGRGGNVKFVGEDAVISKLDALLENKTAPKIIYFTQANGELQLGQTEQRRSLGLSELQRKLEAAHLQVKPLSLELTDAKIPTDAMLVVVASPVVPFQEHAVKAFRDFVGRRGGKMVFLFGVNVGPDKKMVPTGLEGFLKEYQVELGNERILTAGTKDPRTVLLQPNPALADNPLVALFEQVPRGIFRFEEPRPVRVAQAAPPGGSQPFVAQPLYFTMERFAWEEPDLVTAPSELITEMENNDELARKKLKQKPIPVTVLVSESTPDPNNPHEGAPGFDSSKKKPRMLIVGNASFVSNQGMAGQLGELNFAIFDAFVDVLGRDAGSAGIPAKQRDTLMLPGTVTQNPFSVTLIPLGLAVFGLIGLGIGVWVTRRS